MKKEGEARVEAVSELKLIVRFFENIFVCGKFSFRLGTFNFALYPANIE